MIVCSDNVKGLFIFYYFFLFDILGGFVLFCFVFVWLIFFSLLCFVFVFSNVFLLLFVSCVL